MYGVLAMCASNMFLGTNNLYYKDEITENINVIRMNRLIKL